MKNLSVSKVTRRRGSISLGLCAFISSALFVGCDKEGNDPEATLQESTVYIQVEGALREPGSAAITQKWSGSGVIISQDGYIITNNHVAGGSSIRSVRLHGETTTRPATLLGTSECSDLAVLKIEEQGLPSLNWHEGPVGPGLEVMSAGFPGVTGMGTYTLTKGTVSTAPSPLSTSWASVQKAIYHTAQINTGNSGGPLVSQSDASLVGINYAGQASQNASVAIAAPEARTIIEKLKTGTDVNSIGISGDVRFVERNGVRLPIGVWVTAVRPGGRADKLGLRPGDVISKIGGINLQVASEQKNHSLENYCSVLRSNDPNSQVIAIEVMRPDANVVCEGQINGSALKTKATSGQATDCPIGTPGGGVNPGNGGNQGGGNAGAGNPGGGNANPGGTNNGGGTGNQGGNAKIPQINEIEPNQNESQAQTLTPPVQVIGSAKQGDAAIGTPNDPNIGEDLYLFNVAQTSNVIIALEGENGSDFDLYLIDAQSNIVAKQTNRGGGREILRLSLQPGKYGIVVDAWATVTTEHRYALVLGFEK